MSMAKNHRTRNQLDPDAVLEDEDSANLPAAAYYKDFSSLKMGFLGDIDLRTKSARRMNAMLVQFVEDKGGFKHVTLGQTELIRRAATLGMVASTLEEQLMENPDDKDALNKYCAVVKQQSAVLRQLGVERDSKDVNGKEIDHSDLESYLSSSQESTH